MIDWIDKLFPKSKCFFASYSGTCRNLWAPNYGRPCIKCEYFLSEEEANKKRVLKNREQ